MLEITSQGMEFLEKLEKAQKPKEVMEEKFEEMGIFEFETFIENMIMSGEDFLRLLGMTKATEENRNEYLPRGLYQFVLRRMGKEGSNAIKEEIVKRIKEVMDKNETVFDVPWPLIKAATEYAKKTGSRLEEIEEVILKFESGAVEYGIDVIKERWPGLESLIKQFFYSRFEYKYRGITTSDVHKYLHNKGVIGDEKAIREIFGIENHIDIEGLKILITCVDCIRPNVLVKFQNQVIEEKLQELKEALDKYAWVKENDDDRSSFLAQFNTLFNYIEKTRHSCVFSHLVIQVFLFFDKNILDSVIEKIVSCSVPENYKTERQNVINRIESELHDMLFYFRRAWLSENGKKENKESTLAYARWYLVHSKLKQEGERSIFLLHNLFIDNNRQERILIKKLFEENPKFRESVLGELEKAERRLRDGLGFYDNSCAEIDGEDFGFGFKERILQAAIEGASKNLSKYIEKKTELQKFEESIGNGASATSEQQGERHTLTVLVARRLKTFYDTAEPLIKQVVSTRPFSYIFERNKQIEYFMLVIGMENSDWEAYKELIQVLKTNKTLILKRRLRAKRKVAETAQDQSQ